MDIKDKNADAGAPDRTGVRPEIRTLLEELDRQPEPSEEELTPAGRRVSAEETLPGYWGPPEPVDRIDDVVVPTPAAKLRARIYRPANPQGTVFFLHGGGWALGSLDSHDRPCRMLANLVPANVVSFEYRKSPEHPFPAAVIDCDAGLDWLLAEGASLGLATDRVIVSGESAGGNLAAVLARHARDRGIALAGQLLIYPVADTAMDTQSYAAFADGFFLTAETMRWFADQTFTDPEHWTHPDAAPLRADDLASLAPAMVITAEFDPLRDEGRAYAARLVEAGNNVTFEEWKGAIHGFWMMHAVTPATAAVIGSAANWIRQRWAG